MRLPLTAQISTKDGTSNRNARLTNCLKETTKRGDKAVIRPGLVLSDTYTGLGSGLIPFDGRLLSVWADTIYDQNDNGTWPLDAPQWSALETYAFGDAVWLNGDLWFSLHGGNTGNTPGSGGYWARAKDLTESDNYDPAASYAINDSVLSGGIRYYSNVAGNTGHTPASNPNWWSTTSIGDSRFKINSVSVPYGGSFGAGPLSGSREGATDGAQSLITPRSCVTGNWVGNPAAPNYSSGNWYGNTQWYGGSCATPLGPFVGSIGIITQTV